MDYLRMLLSRCAALLRRQRLDEDLDEELRSHIQLAMEEKMQRGMSEQQARTAALRAFGGVTQTREDYRSQRGLPFLEVLWSDLRYAFRQLWKSPGFTLTTALTLAIGIGMNTAMFSMMDAVVLRPLAVPDLSRVVVVAEEHGRGDTDYQQVALGNYQDWKQQSRSFEDLAVIRNWTSMSLTGAGEATHVDVAFTSANFFKVMRTNALVGRVYQDRECQQGHNRVAVLSYAFWQKQFGADRAEMGRSIELDGQAYAVIGVMPKSMQYPAEAKVFLPLAPTPQQLENRTAHDYLVVGRLRRDVSVHQAQEELRVIGERLAKAYPASNLGWSVRVEPLLDGINGELTPLFYRLIMAAAGFVLLVVCANVANLQFVRGISRRPEVAVRTALGASRGRLLGHLLTENLVLGVMGAAGGLLLAALCMHLCLIAMPATIAKHIAGWSNTSLNGHALAFSLLLALAAGLLSGLLPALKAMRVNLVDQLKAGSRTTSASRETHRLRDVFSVSQISFSVLLVIGAALMCKGLWSMLHMADAYQPKQVLTFRVDLPSRYATDERRAAWFNSSLDKLRALPGVASAEITTGLPHGQEAWNEDFRIENRPVAPGKFQSTTRLAVTGGYIEGFRIPLLSGRNFNRSDTIDTQPVAIISRKFAERYFPAENPLGRRLQLGATDNHQAPWIRIVGVVGDVNYLWIDRGNEPAMYLNATQMPPTGAIYVINTTGDPMALAPGVRQALATLDPAIPLDDVETYQAHLNVELTGLIYTGVLLSIDAAIALLLAAIGIFGVMANVVAERTQEIGVRIALGAKPEAVLGMIMRRAALLTSIGVAIGTILAFGLARLSANLFFGVRPDDPSVFISIITAITVVALLVSWGPARRAASVDPVRALRAE